MNGRDSPQHDLKAGVNSPYAVNREPHHLGKLRPVRIKVKVPMGEIVRLIPQHYRFHHKRHLLRRESTLQQTPGPPHKAGSSCWLWARKSTSLLPDGKGFSIQRCAKSLRRLRNSESTNSWDRSSNSFR